MKQIIQIIVLVTYITTHTIISVTSKGDTTFGYGGIDGPAKWATLSPANSLCDTGTQQSPVNFASKDVQQNVLPADFALPSITQFNMTDKGHTVEFTPLDDTSGQMRGMTIDGQRFSLQQFHLHTPSEHRIDNVFFDGEMHFVHMAPDNKISVVAMFIQKSASDNPLWANVLNNLPSRPDSTVALNTIFETADIVQAAKKGVFTYSGSLTTPPCSEGVRWFVTNTPMQMSPSQLHTISSLIGFSARPVMANANVSPPVEGNAHSSPKPTSTAVANPAPGEQSSDPCEASAPAVPSPVPVPSSPVEESSDPCETPALPVPSPAPVPSNPIIVEESSDPCEPSLVLREFIFSRPVRCKLSRHQNWIIQRPLCDR